MKTIDSQLGDERASRRERSWSRVAQGLFFCLMIASVGSAGALAQTPQTAQQWMDKGLKDLESQTAPKLVDANQAFTEAVKLEPNNHRALALKTISSLLLVPQDSALQKLLTDAGYTERSPDPAAPSLTPIFDQPVDADGIFLPEAGAKTDQLLAYLNSRRTFIDGLLAELEKIKDPQFNLALGEGAGEGGATDMDYADVRALRAVMFLAKGLIALGNSHNLKLEYRQIYDLYAQGRLSMQELAGRLPNILKFADQTQRTNARRQLLLAEDETQAAIAAFAQRAALPEGRSFIFEVESAEEAQSASEALTLLANALTREVTLPQAPWVTAEFAGQRLDLSPIFTSSAPLRRLLPGGFAGSGAFQRGTWPSTSLGGIFPGLDGDLLDKAAASLWFEINDNSYFFLEPAIYRPYTFTTIRSGLPPEWIIGGLAIASNGDTLVADNNAGAIRKITSAGASSNVLTSSQIPGNEGWLWFCGLGTDAADRIYFSDGWRVFRREVSGVISLLAGTDSPPGWDYTPRDGSGAAAVFAWISTLAADAAGNVYVVDGGTSIRKISPTGQVTTLAGQAYTYGFVDGPGKEARFQDSIRGSIGVDGSGNIWVADGGRTIRKVGPDGTTSTVVSTAPGRNLHYDDALNKASFYEIGGLTADNEGNVFVADGTTIRKVTASNVMTIGGRPHAAGSRDGRGEQSRLSMNSGGRLLAMDKNGKLRTLSEGRLFRAEAAPVIAEHPVSAQAYRGERVVFTVTAGATNPSYQWSFNGIPIKGATSQSHSVLASNRSAGDYTVNVKDGPVTETSNTATLSLRPNANWTWAASSNTDQTREVGEPLNLAVENVSGPPGSPISYQWFKDGRLLRGRTSRSLIISSVSLADAGMYELVITTSAGKEPTGPRRLTVPDRGLLIYNLSGTGFAATTGDTRSRRESAVVVVDRANQKTAFLWHASDASGKRFHVEYPEGTSMHSTGPSVGSTSVLSRAVATGSEPNIGKDVVWFTGTDAWRRLNGNNGLTSEILGPVRMKGSVHTLSLSAGVAIERLDASMSLDVAQTLRARAGSREEFDQAMERITEEFAARGYLPGL